MAQFLNVKRRKWLCFSWPRWFLAKFSTFFPFLKRCFPSLESLLVEFISLSPDAIKQFLSRLKLVFVFFAPLRRQFAFKGVLQHSLPIDLELCPRRLQALDTLVQLGKEFLDFGGDVTLFAHELVVTGTGWSAR